MTSLRQRLAERAGFRCEYCKLHSALQRTTYHADHVQPVSRGGPDDEANRAFACPTCNLAKSNRLILVDPESGARVPVFNPRRDAWGDHFRFEGYLIVGKTPVGRAMIAALDMNETQCVFIRSIEAARGLFPPPDST
jgi:hypothetical protein